jgi:hypothetical protein
MALSPDNQLLAIGGQNSDITIWSVKEKLLLKTFQSVPGKEKQLDQQDAVMKDNDDLSEAEQPSVNVFDINWSSDGTLVSAGINKSVVVLDMAKVLGNLGEQSAATLEQSFKTSQSQVKQSSPRAASGHQSRD